MLIAAPDLVERTAEIVGLVESLDSKVDRLLDGDFKAGSDFLDQADRTTSTEEKKHLYREARFAFTKSASLADDSQDGEQLLRRGLSRLGIWHCCNALGDKQNAERELERIVEISSEPSFWTSWRATNYQYSIKGVGPAAMAIGVSDPAASVVSVGIAAIANAFSKKTEGELREIALAEVDPERLEFIKLQAVIIGLMTKHPIGDAFDGTEEDSHVMVLANIIQLSIDEIRGQEDDVLMKRVSRLEMLDGKLHLEAEFESSVNGSKERETWEFTFSSDFEEIVEAKEIR